MHLLDVSLKRCVSKELGFRENLGSNMGLPGKLGCHILEVLLVTLTALRSRRARWATTFEEKIMIIYHWQSGLCGDNLPFPGILPDKYFNTADAKKKPTTICPKRYSNPLFLFSLTVLSVFIPKQVGQSRTKFA